MIATAHLIASGVTGLYGLVCIAGGIIGYVRADSVPSLVAAGTAGVLLLLCAAGVFYQPAVSLSGAIIIAFILLGWSIPKSIQQWNRFGESTLGPIALVVAIGGVLAIVVCALALLTKAVPPSGP